MLIQPNLLTDWIATGSMTHSCYITVGHLNTFSVYIFILNVLRYVLDITTSIHLEWPQSVITILKYSLLSLTPPPLSLTRSPFRLSLHVPLFLHKDV